MFIYILNTDVAKEIFIVKDVEKIKNIFKIFKDILHSITHN